MRFPRIFPSKNDVEGLRETFHDGEWYILPLAILAFVVWLWPLVCAAFAQTLYVELKEVQQK